MVHIIEDIKKFFFAIIYNIVKHYISISKNKWVIGSDGGNYLSGNSKYFIKYFYQVNKNNVRLIFISKNKLFINKINSNGIEAYYNYSLKGLYHVLSAEVYLLSTTLLDINFINHKKTRIVNLWHGMPIKKVVYDNTRNQIPINVWYLKLVHILLGNHTWEDVDMNIVTSDYFGKIFQGAFNNSKNIILGQPRDDVFYKEDLVKINRKVRKLFSAKNKIIISYLPTHRKYGYGKAPKPPFLNNYKIIDYFNNKNIILIAKNHINMQNQYHPINIEDALIEVNHDFVDTQELLIATDILISDYSGVIFDFLHLGKPIICYHYDDYINDDSEIYFNSSDEFPGSIAYDEDSLIEIINEIIETPDNYTSILKNLFDKYMFFHDGLSTNRIYDRIIEDTSKD